MKFVINRRISDGELRELIYQNRQILAAVIVSLMFILGTIMKIGLKNILQLLPPFSADSTTTAAVRRPQAQGESTKIQRRRAVVGETYNPDADKTTEVVKHQKTKAQREKLKQDMKKVVLLQKLHPEQFEQILDAFFLKTVKAGEYVIKEGDEGDYFYVIDKGVYTVLAEVDGEAKVIQTYTDVGSFGELALLYSIPRAASVKADVDGLLWALDRKTFRRIVIKAAYKNRKNYVDLIKTVKILSHLSEMERMSLADSLHEKVFKDGDVILKEGDQADGMYFVIEGQVAISKMVNGKKVNLKSIEKGGYFGELALLNKAQRAATAGAKGSVTTAFLDAQAFSRLMGACEDEMRANLQKYGIKKENIV